MKNLVTPATRVYEGIRTYARPLYPLIRNTARIIVSVSARLKHFELLPGETYTYYRYALGMYEPGTTAVVKKLLQPGMVAVDVGAHIGHYTRLFARLVGEHGKVYAFEADPRTFAVLERNTTMFSNVSLFNMAALDRETAIRLYESPGRSGRNSIWESNAGVHTESIVVKAGTLDKMLADVSPQLMKIDVEGSELEVLHGMPKLLSRSNDLVLIVEWSPSCQVGRGMSPNRLIENIQSLGFKISAIDETTGRVERMNVQCDLERQFNQIVSYLNLLCTRS